jgi:hypothetical protein
LKIFLTILIFISCITKSHAQNYFPYKTPKQNVAWIDSMKRIIGKVFEVDEKKKNNWKKQLDYVNTCATIGRYWEWAYEKRYVKNMGKALVYYKKIIDLPRFPDDERYFKALAIRNNLNRKLEDIYFKGKGVKRNKNLSLEFALQGITYNKELVDFYSKRYYGNTKKYYYNGKAIDSVGNSIFYFRITPLAFRIPILPENTLDKELKLVFDDFSKKNKKDSVNLYLEFNGLLTSYNQAIGHEILYNLRTILISKYKIPENLFILDSSPEYENSYYEFIVSIKKVNNK